MDAMNDNAMRRMDLDVFMLKSVILCSGRIIEDVNNIDVGQCNDGWNNFWNYEPVGCASEVVDI